MATLILKCGTTLLVDDGDLERLSSMAWYINSSGYVVYSATISRRKKYFVLMHRYICGLEYGDRRIVDHINGNQLDNRRSNLRVCTPAENMQNRRLNKNSTSGLKGVTWNRQCGKWHAQIRVNGKRLYLGLHDTPEMAHLAYCEAAMKLHGEFYNPGYTTQSKDKP